MSGEEEDPQTPSEAVAKVLRGSRRMLLSHNVSRSTTTSGNTGGSNNNRGLEDVDEFWDAAKTPNNNNNNNNNKEEEVENRRKSKRNQQQQQQQQQQQRSSPKRLVRSKKGKKKKPASFALSRRKGGLENDNENMNNNNTDDDGDDDIERYHHQSINVMETQSLMRKIKGTLSPSELSKVSTLPPPTPEQEPYPTMPDETLAQEPIQEEELQQEIEQQQQQLEIEPPTTQEEEEELQLQQQPKQNDEQEEFLQVEQIHKQITNTTEHPSTQLEEVEEEEHFPMVDDNDNLDVDVDDDDLLPPAPPEDEYTSEPSVAGTASVAGSLRRAKKRNSTSSTKKKLTPTQTQTHTLTPPPPVTTKQQQRQRQPTPTTPALDERQDDDDDNDNDNDNDDKEGAGFLMMSPLTPTPKQDEIEQEPTPKETKPPKKKAGRPKKQKTPSPPPPQKKTKKTKKNKYATLPVTPKGVQSGPIEHEYVPVTDYKITPKEQGLRRSNRSKIKPLAFWKNERPVFGANSATGYLKEAMGAMPVVMGYEKAMPTPYKKRKIAHRNNHDGAGMNKKKKGYNNNNNNSNNNIQYQDEPVIVEQKPFDARKLKKKFDFHTGQEATMWDESLEEPSEMKVVAFASKAKSSELPLPRSRKKHEGKVVGTASQSFNVPSGDNDVSIGYIMGNLCLPPNAIKDPESTGACSQVFTVCSCQPKSLEVAFGDPAEEDGNFVPETAQRFLLSAGDQFRIPPGNAYRLHNHSKTTDSQLAWTIIRPKYSNEENSSAA